VRGAVRAEGPIVLPDGHLVDRRPRRSGVGRAVADLADELADPGEFRAEMVVDLYEVSADGAAVIGIDGAGGRLGPRWPGGVVPPAPRAQPLAPVRGRCEADAVRCL